MIVLGSGIQLMIEQTITVGNIIEIISIVGGGIGVFATLRATVRNLGKQVEAMQTELKQLSVVITAMAVTDNRLTNVEQDIRELRHGRGFVQGERHGINGEYPR
jgi:prefoldin subunit 5